MTTIKSHLSTGELEARYEGAGDPIAKRHFHALWLLSKGYDLDEVAELLSFSTRWVPRAEIGTRSTRLGCAGRHRVFDPEAATAPSGDGERGGSSKLKKTSASRR
jgi:hypothetical protein